ncbi:MAG: hypothetical protein ACRDGM_10775 [bacterium]
MDKIRSGYQQGDLLLIRRETMPEGGKVVGPSNGRYVLAEGEHTGHAHVIEAVPGIELREVNGILWLRVTEERPATHEEHKPQTLEPGIYEIGRVQEVDPFTDEVRAVMD